MELRGLALSASELATLFSPHTVRVPHHRGERSPSPRRPRTFPPTAAWDPIRGECLEIQKSGAGQSPNWKRNCRRLILVRKLGPSSLLPGPALGARHCSTWASPMIGTGYAVEAGEISIARDTGKVIGFTRSGTNCSATSPNGAGAVPVPNAASVSIPPLPGQ
jgi:hypothetical protein